MPAEIDNLFFLACFKAVKLSAQVTWSKCTFEFVISISDISLWSCINSAKVDTDGKPNFVARAPLVAHASFDRIGSCG